MSIDFEKLLKLRLVVAHFGEMDLARWWNTKAQLGLLGALALRRGFPRTYHFAQAARSLRLPRSDAARSSTLQPRSRSWQLPEALQDEFEFQWEFWLDD
jgi:hypothetical protein